MRNSARVVADNVQVRAFLLAAGLLLTGCPIVVTDVARGYNDQCAQQLAAGALDDAQTACDRALEHQPRYWDALHNLGLIRQLRGDRASARRLFIEALRANPNMAQSHNQLGALAMEERHWRDASEHFQAALVLVPEYLEARRNLGVCLLRQQRYDDAERAFRQLLLTHPQNVQGHVGLGLCFAERQRWDDALPWFLKASELDVNDAGVWKALGAAYQGLGRSAEAKDAVERCLLADPEELECRQALDGATSD